MRSLLLVLGVVALGACASTVSEPLGVAPRGEQHATVLVRNLSGGPVELVMRAGGSSQSIRVYPGTECVAVRGLVQSEPVTFGLRLLAHRGVVWDPQGSRDVAPGQGWLLTVSGENREELDLNSMRPGSRCEGSHSLAQRAA